MASLRQHSHGGMHRSEDDDYSHDWLPGMPGAQTESYNDDSGSSEDRFEKEVFDEYGALELAQGQRPWAQ